MAEYGQGGRVVAYNAEYDALPGIGHACGHNLIAMMSIGAFIGVAELLKERGITGRVRLVGTPAEEGMGGKIPIIKAGAFEDVDACMMVHPGPFSECQGFTGDAYMPTLANHKFNVTYKGQTAHAAMAPWEGINALDAAVLAYNGISVLRQQVHPSNRIHCVISDGGLRPNVIPGSASLDCYIRCPTLKGADELLSRVRRCFEGASLQSGCEMEFTMYVMVARRSRGINQQLTRHRINTYADLRPNKTICSVYAEAMAALGSEVKCDSTSTGVPGSTDQGNVSYACPSTQTYVGIPAEPGCNNHTAGFTAVAGTKEAHRLCLEAAKGMAVAGWKILAEDQIAAAVRRDFEVDEELR